MVEHEDAAALASNFVVICDFAFLDLAVTQGRTTADALTAGE